MSAEWVAAAAAILSVPISVYALRQARLAMSMSAPVPTISVKGHKIDIGLSGDNDRKWEIYRLKLTLPEEGEFLTLDPSDPSLPFVRLGRTIETVPRTLLISRAGDFEVKVYFRLINERARIFRATPIKQTILMTAQAQQIINGA